jgi:hypothetical protein
MKNLLDKIIKTTKTDRELVLEALKASTVCKAINNNFRETEKTNGETRMLLNPHNQKCFNFGWFTYQDFHDWTKGQGKIVKGDTPEEKQKFWEAAVFESEHDYGWSIGYYMKHFGCIDETYKQELNHTYTTSVKVPLKITKTNHLEIIAKVFGDICRYYSDTELTYTSHLQTKIDSELMGAKQVLFMLGVGYYGASNTPEEPENLSWVADIAKYKAVYLCLLKKGVKIPDYDFIYSRSKGLV